jgi:Flp pilus assembly protein TadG
MNLRLYNRHAARSGAAVVEAAILIPFLLMLAVGVTDVATVYYASVYVSSAASNGAQWGSQSMTNAQNTPGVITATQLDKLDMPTAMWNKFSNDYNYTGSNPAVTVVLAPEPSGSDWCLRVTVAYTFPTLIKYPGLPSTLTVRHTACNRVLSSN